MPDFVCAPSRNLPVKDGVTYDGGAARLRMLDAAGIGGDKPNPAQAKRGFLIHDASAPNLRGSYHLPFADVVVDGTLTAIGNGVRNAASRLPQMNGLSDAARTQARAVIDGYMAMMGSKEAVQKMDMEMPSPAADETQPAFMSRCVDHMLNCSDDLTRAAATAYCAVSWDNRPQPGAAGKQRSDADGLVEKTLVAPPPGGDTLEFVMSDDSVDRMGDIIEQSGWQLANFKKNPIALFGHNSSFIVGNWKNVRVVGNQLVGQMDLMPPVSDRLREVHAAIAGGVLRAVSVGFRPLPGQTEPIEGSKVGGVRFLKSELVECSLVAVPANPNALQRAKELNLSSEIMSLIFGKTANEGQLNRVGTPGKPASNPRNPSQSRRTPMNLSEKIQAAEARLNSLKDQLTDQIGKQDEGGMDEQAETVIGELNERIAAEQRQLDMLKASEAVLGSRSDPVINNADAGGGASSRRPFALPKKDIRPADYVYRGLAAALLSHITKRPIDMVLRDRYGDDEPTHKVAEATVMRAAVVPATTTLTGWAAELVQTSFGDFIDTLMPDSIYPGLSAIGGRFTFGRNGIVSLPARNRTPTIAGGFVAEGAAIPVKQGAFSSVTLTPRSMKVISTFTRQLAQHSTPAIEQEIRKAMQEDTAVAMDTILLDATIGDAIRPPGLLYGVNVTTATSGGGFAALVGDIKALVGVLSAANSLRSPVWIMNPVDVLSLTLTQNAGGDFPFAAEANAGRLGKYPIIQSTTQTAGTVILVDAADFFSATGEEPMFDVSDQATLHMESSAPQAIGLSGSATLPIRSMFQTDSIALRMMIDVSWAMRRTGVIAYTSSVTW